MKTTFYFSHDIDARNDEKIQDLLMKMGYEGLGLYWSLVEMLYSMDGKGELDKINTYAFALRTDSEKLKTLINIVFEKNNKYFWSNTILQRLKKIEEKSKKAKLSAKKRWTKQSNPTNADAMQTHSEGNANKVNKSKVNKNKEINKELSLYLEKFNTLFDKKYQPTKGRQDRLAARLKTYTLEQVLQATINLSKSAFHRGKNDHNWVAGPDFIIRNDEQIDKWLNTTPQRASKTSALSEIPNHVQEIANLPKPTAEEMERIEKIKEKARKEILPRLRV